MRKIINNKLYDTDTAKEIGSWSYGASSDFDWIQETLYLKKTGEFFLHGEGGPRSKYSKTLSYNCWGYGNEIIPEANFNVREWAEENLDTDTYIQYFGPVEE